jgi:lipoprotein-releasing system permease protein
MYEYDANLAYAKLEKAQELFGSSGMVSGISVRVDDVFRATAAKRTLQVLLGSPYVVRTWMDSNRTLLGALKLEKTVMFLILTLIVMVACFNIASTLIMTVLEKTKDIGVLKAIGATRPSIMRIFAYEGGLIGLAGTAVGAALGIAACWLLKTYQFINLPKDIYYVDKLPVIIEWQEISVIILSSLVLSLLATVYPSFQASRLDPVEALRYE